MLAPSRVEGACDATTIDWPVPYLDPTMPRSGAVAHTCFPDGSADAFTVVRPLTIVP